MKCGFCQKPGQTPAHVKACAAEFYAAKRTTAPVTADAAKPTDAPAVLVGAAGGRPGPRRPAPTPPAAILPAPADEPTVTWEPPYYPTSPPPPPLVTPPAPPTPMVEMATSSQRGFIAKCLRGKVLPDPLPGEMPNFVKKYHDSTLTKASARYLLDYLAAQPWAQGPSTGHRGRPPVNQLEDGFYIKNDVIYKIVHAVHGSGKQYAKQLEVWPPERQTKKKKGEFVYVGQAPLRVLTPEDALTYERAKELGKLYGMCCICGATLTDEKSIEAGIGPVCGKKVR